MSSFQPLEDAVAAAIVSPEKKLKGGGCMGFDICPKNRLALVLDLVKRMVCKV